MNLILEQSGNMQFHTNMKLVIEAFGGRFEKLDWLVTDYDMSYKPPTFKSSQPVFMGGVKLSEIISNNDIQFSWAVFSGFEQNFLVNSSSLEVEPYADGNSSFWKKSPKIQYPGAILEIVCFDSSLTLLITDKNDYSDLFKKAFPESKALNELNRT